MIRICLLLSLLSAPLISGELLTPELLWQFGRVSSPTVSPDGQWVAYVVKHYDWRKNKDQSDIHLVDINGKQHRQLTAGPANESQPTWSEDGRSLYFVSNRTGDSQLFRIALDGGEAIQLTHFDAGFSNFKLAPKAKFITFTRDVVLEPEVHGGYDDLPEANALIFDRLKFRHWDTWDDGSYHHLFSATLAGENARDLMAGKFTDTPLKPFGGPGDIVISPDGAEICYTALEEGRPAGSTDTGLYLVKPDGGAAKLITPGMGGYETHPAYSPDGKYLAFLSMKTPGYESDRNRIMLYNRASGKITEFTKGLDQTVNAIAWLDGKTLVFNAPVKGTIQLYEMAVPSGKIRQITQGRHNLSSFNVAAGQIVALKSTHERPNEVMRIDRHTGALTKLTGVNDAIVAKLDLPKVEERWVTASDGKPLHSWVIYPPNFDPKGSYPLITYCQGGPQGMVSQFFSYRWNFHLMAANGYVVVAVNRRGLPGFGREWNDSINRDYGGQAMEDLKTATDALIAEPFIDANRTAAVGASFGGYSVFKLMGQNAGPNKRWKTMIAHCGLFNMESWYLSTEELFFASYDQGGPYWTSKKQKEMYARHSPHNYVDKWETPILVIHGEKDYRVPVAQGLQAFTAAKLKGLDARFLYFPEENHWVLTPQNGILWHRVFYQWLAKTNKKKNRPSSP